MFVNFPRWEKDVPVSVAEVMKDGSLKPYPDAGWNAWSNRKPLSAGDRWVCVQSVTVDPQGFLWVVNPAAPGNMRVAIRVHVDELHREVNVGSGRNCPEIRLDNADHGLIGLKRIGRVDEYVLAQLNIRLLLRAITK